MERIRDITLYFGDKKENKYGLTVIIEATHDGQDIKSASFVYVNKDKKITHSLDPDKILATIIFHINEVYCGDTLLSKLRSYLSTIDINDLARVIPCENSTSIKQCIIDHFITRLIGYISSLYLLLNCDLWECLPFSFTIPIREVTSNVLYQSLFRYLSYPLQGMLSLMGDVPEKQLFLCMTEFINIWSPLFDEGPHYDTSRVMMEVSTAFFSQMACIMTTIKSYGVNLNCDNNSNCDEIRTEINSINYRINKIEKDIQYIKKFCYYGNNKVNNENQ